MKFYVSGPVVDELNEKELVGRIYLLIEKILKGHQVELPLRSRDLDKLSPTRFYDSVRKLIKKSDGVISVLAGEDLSGPVESTLASIRKKPQCMMEMSASAPRLLRGLPGMVDVTTINEKDGNLEQQVRRCLESLLKDLGAAL